MQMLFAADAGTSAKTAKDGFKAYFEGGYDGAPTEGHIVLFGVIAVAVIAAVIILAVIILRRSKNVEPSELFSSFIDLFKAKPIAAIREPELASNGKPDRAIVSGDGDRKKALAWTNSEHPGFGPLAELVKNDHVRAFLEAGKDMDIKIRNLLGSSKLQPSPDMVQPMAVGIVRQILDNGQDLARKLLSDRRCVVSLKIWNEKTPDMLRCYYPASGAANISAPRLTPKGIIKPDMIPINGTLPGWVFSRGEEKFLERIENLDELAGVLSAAEFARIQDHHIRSMVGWPVRLYRTVTAVVVVDSPIAGSLKKSCPLTEILLELITVKIGTVLTIMLREEKLLAAVLQTGSANGEENQ